MDHNDPLHLHTYYYDWLIMIYITSLGPTHIQMRFMVWLCLHHVSHLVCGAVPSSQTIRAATGADGAPNRRHSARPQGARGLTPTRRATTPVSARSSTRGLARAARRARRPGRPPMGYSLRRLTGSYRYPDMPLVRVFSPTGLSLGRIGRE